MYTPIRGSVITRQVVHPVPFLSKRARGYTLHTTYTETHLQILYVLHARLRPICRNIANNTHNT